MAAALERRVLIDTVLPIVFAFAVMVGFAVGSDRIAERKGYSFTLFAFLGLFLGILAIIVAALIPRKKAAYAGGVDA